MTGPRTRPRIFVIGFNRTGTTSLHEMFRQSGLASVHYRTRPDNRVVPSYLAANFSAGRPLLTGIDEFDAYLDLGMHSKRFVFEGAKLFPRLHAEYPDACFILNTRPVDGWIASRLGHGEGRIAENFIATFGCTQADLPALWRHQFESHCREVRAHFAAHPGRFLEFDITADDPARVRDFLAPDHRIDIAHWGRRNTTEDRIARLARAERRTAPQPDIPTAAAPDRPLTRRRENG